MTVSEAIATGVLAAGLNFLAYLALGLGALYYQTKKGNQKKGQQQFVLFIIAGFFTSFFVFELYLVAPSLIK